MLCQISVIGIQHEDIDDQKLYMNFYYFQTGEMIELNKSVHLFHIVRIKHDNKILCQVVNRIELLQIMNITNH